MTAFRFTQLSAVFDFTMTTIVFKHAVEGYPRVEAEQWHPLDYIQSIQFEHMGKVWTVPLTNIAAIIEQR